MLSSPARAEPPLTARRRETAVTAQGELLVEPRPRHVPGVLLIEDNPGDVELTMLGFQADGVIADFRVAADGVQAMAMLRDVAAGIGGWRPDLVLIDLNLPGISGQRVLEFIRGQAALADIPIAVLTSSNGITDFLACSALGVDAYLIKPMTLAALLEMMKQIEPMLGRGR